MLLAPLRSAAAPTAPAAPPSSADARLARAKELFDKGYALLKAGDCERALGLFKRSLGEAPSSSSTMNAAYCLNELKRSDEALEMYEDLLTTFAAELGDQDRALIEAAIRELRKKVGSVEISANVEAEVVIDGRARGKLPAEAPIRVNEGEHVVRVLKDGYDTFEREVTVAAGAIVSVDVQLKPTLPPPPPPPKIEGARAYPFVAAFGGYAITDSLGSTAEHERCLLPCSPVSGVVLGIRSGYRLSVGVAVELSLGYLAVASQFNRGASRSFYDPSTASRPTEVVYTLKDDLRLRGAFLGLGGSYRIALSPRVGLIGRATVGLLNAQSTDFISGSARTTGASAPIVVAARSQILPSQPGFLLPELGVEARWGPLFAGVLVGVVLLTTDGPFFSHREVGVEGACTAQSPAGSVGCAPNQVLVDSEHAYGTFVLWLPTISAGYSF